MFVFISGFAYLMFCPFLLVVVTVSENDSGVNLFGKNVVIIPFS